MILYFLFGLIKLRPMQFIEGQWRGLSARSGDSISGSLFAQSSDRAGAAASNEEQLPMKTNL